MSKKENTTTTLFVYEKPKSTISEKFRGIRSNIMFSKANGEVKRLLVTSEKPGAGKSTVVSNVAITYAQAGYKTLLLMAICVSQHKTIFLMSKIIMDYQA